MVLFEIHRSETKSNFPCFTSALLRHKKQTSKSVTEYSWAIVPKENFPLTLTLTQTLTPIGWGGRGTIFFGSNCPYTVADRTFKHNSIVTGFCIFFFSFFLLLHRYTGLQEQTFKFG